MKTKVLLMLLVVLGITLAGCYIDIMPGSDKNPVNVNKKGVLAVALAGPAEGTDVTGYFGEPGVFYELGELDPTADYTDFVSQVYICFSGMPYYHPVFALEKYKLEDVTGLSGEPDGHLDLIVYFDVPEVVEDLLSWGAPLEDGDEVSLAVNWYLGGSHYLPLGDDTVTIVKKGN